MRGGRVGHYAHLWGPTFTYTSTCPPAACHAHLHAQFHAPKNGHGGRAILLTHFCQQLILWPTAGMRIKSIKDTHTCSFDMQTCVCVGMCVCVYEILSTSVSCLTSPISRPRARWQEVAQANREWESKLQGYGAPESRQQIVAACAYSAITWPKANRNVSEYSNI